jgi:FtsP/CotA-like multicopper oxidase with cupredoxin domain
MTAAKTGTVPKNAKRPQPKGGSRKGRPNKTTAQLREMVLQALDEAGGVMYLVRQAKRRNPAPFMALLGKVLPMQVTGADGGPIEASLKVTFTKPDQKEGADGG